MNENIQTIIISEIVDTLVAHKVSGMDAISMLEFIKFHILQGDLIKE